MIEDRTIVIEVDTEVINKVRTGEITHLCLDINDDNYTEILENIDGHLLLVVDEMPSTFHGCYLYNKGVFPYAIKKLLDFLLLKSDEVSYLTKIIGYDTTPGTRFRFQGDGKPSVEDPDGDSCIWEVAFELVPIPAEPRFYLMRWNPSISSFTEKDYDTCLKNKPFRINWSIYEWQEARRGDYFYMMRVGDEKAGIVFRGQFLSDPYPEEDWAGSTKRRMYVDMICTNTSDANPLIPLNKLTEAISSINWSKGHSGELLTEDVASQISELLEQE